MTPEQPNPNPESERVPNLADAIPTNADAVQADPKHQPALVKLPPRPETYVLENASDGIMWRVYQSPTNGSLCLSFSTEAPLNKLVKDNLAQFEIDEIVNIPTWHGAGYISDILIISREDIFAGREFYYTTYQVTTLESGVAYWFTEAQLLDYDNPRDIHANVVTRAYDYHYQGGQYRPPAQRVNPFKNLLTFKPTQPKKD